MGLHITMAVQEDNSVVFSDLDAMNVELWSNTDIATLMEDEDHCDFVAIRDGKLVFWDRENGEWNHWPTVWSAFDERAAQIMGQFCLSGSLVLRLDIEGNHPEWFKIEPGKGGSVQPKF